MLIYYTTPRYAADDYRPLIRQVIQQGNDQDGVLALFPWQVGYWRAYAPRDASGDLLGPQPAPVDQQALEWDERMIAQVEQTLGVYEQVLPVRALV